MKILRGIHLAIKFKGTTIASSSLPMAFAPSEVYRGMTLRCRVPTRLLGNTLTRSSHRQDALSRHTKPHSWSQGEVYGAGAYVGSLRLLPTSPEASPVQQPHGTKGIGDEVNAFVLGRLAITDIRGGSVRTCVTSVGYWRKLSLFELLEELRDEHSSQPQRTPRRCLPLRLSWCRLSLRPAVHSSPQW